jgi:glycosyltransferase involved in cell wall biosynthesis/peptidoglycan/xylan/chitin deacetylase (PgdA/CDA1 family)
MFHRVLPAGQTCYDPEMVTSAAHFANFLDWAKERYQIEPIEEIVARKARAIDPKRPLAAITFDDGWLDNYRYAFPLLRERELQATIFLPLRFIGTARHFWQEQLWFCLTHLAGRANQQEVIREVSWRFPWFPGRLAETDLLSGIRKLLMTRPSEEADEFVDSLSQAIGESNDRERSFLNWTEVSEMKESGIHFGSHTLNHSLLTNSTPKQAAAEIQDSASELSERLGLSSCGFAYPWGAAGWFAREAAKETYSYALTTRAGMVSDQSDPWLLPRIAISDRVLSYKDSFEPGKAQLWFIRQICSEKMSADRLKPGTGDARIKITFVIDQITEWEGGTERQLHALISALDRRYFDPELLFIFQSDELPQETLPCRTRALCRGIKAPWFGTRILLLAQALRESRPDIVQTFFIEGIVAGILASRLAGVQKIVGSARNAGYWKKKRHRIAFRSVSRLAHHWQCNSRALVDYTAEVERVGREKIEILPNALDLSLFKPPTAAERIAVRNLLGLDRHAPVFISVANLTAVKDISALLQAAKLLQSRFPNAQYLIVGDGPLRQGLQQQAKELGLDSVVRFLGRQGDVRPYLGAADFGVLTSHSEGSSNSLLEYMATGLPSAVSDIPPNRELVTGLLFRPGDTVQLSERLAQLITDGQVCFRLREEYARVVPQYSQERFITRVQSYYNRLAAKITK